MNRLALLLVGSVLTACAASPGPASPPNGETAPSAEPSSPPDRAGGAQTQPADAATSKPATAGLLDRAALEQKKSLDQSETPFPSIDAVTAELGAPHAKAKLKRLEYWYDSKTEGTLTSCETIDVIGLPSGGATLHGSVLTSKDCKKAKSKGKDVSAILTALGRPKDADQPLDLQISEPGLLRLDAATKQFRDKLGAPNVEEEVDVATWKYRGDDEGCKLLVVTSHLQSHAGQALWDVPCE